MTSCKAISRNGYSEVRPRDDYRGEFSGFRNRTNSRGKQEINKWANDTYNLATKSFYLYFFSAPLKFLRHFVESSDYSDSFAANAVYASERLFGMLGDVHRNFIYGHKDSEGNRDDNLGAQDHEIEKHGHDSTLSIGRMNYYSQTGGKLLLLGVGLFNSEIANDIEWAVVNTLDRWWWRGMGSNLAFGSDFGKRAWDSFTGQAIVDENGNTENPVSWKFLKGKFTEHLRNTRKALRNFTNTDKSNKRRRKEYLLDFCEHADRTVSCFSPIVNGITVAGSILRPIARRLELGGWSRDLIRTASVIDKPLIWLNNIFRFYIPERFISGRKDPLQSKNNLFNFFKIPDILLLSTGGSIVDFFSQSFFENVVKEKSGSIKHMLDLTGDFTKNLEEMYLSLRRTYAKRDIEVEKRKSMYEKLKETNSN